MTALLQGVVAMQGAVGGGLYTTLGSTPPHHFHNGIPYEEDGSVAMATGAPNHYHQGLGFSANGRLIAVAANPDYFGSGAAPFLLSNPGRLCSSDVAIDHVSSGVSYSITDRVSAAGGAPTKTYVLTDGPNWSILDGAGAPSWRGQILGGVEFVHINGNTIPDTALAFGTLVATNVEISQVMNYSSSVSGDNAMLGCARMVDVDNYVGWRSNNSAIQVYNVVAGVFTNIQYLGSSDWPSPLVGSVVKMNVSGSVLTMTINGEELIGDDPITFLGAGRVGAVGRPWTSGPTMVFSAYEATSLDKAFSYAGQMTVGEDGGFVGYFVGNYGELVPREVGGALTQYHRVNTSFQPQMNYVGGVNIPDTGLDNVSVSYEGFSGNPVEYRWDGGSTRYVGVTLNEPLYDFLTANLGNTIGITIVETPPWTGVLSVGTNTDFAGYYPSQDYGGLIPDEIEGIEFIELRAQAATNLGIMRLLGDAQIPSFVDQADADITFEGYPANPVRFNWTEVGGRYNTVANSAFTDWLFSRIDHDLNVTIEEAPP